MDDDFNTADAISALFELVKLANTTVTENSSKAYAELVKTELEKLCEVLGIVTERHHEALDEEIEKMIADRQQARKDRNFALADEIRAETARHGHHP